MNDIHLRIREMNSEDMDDLFIWRNHPDNRKNFFNPDPVGREEHERWFNKKLRDAESIVYIAYYGGDKIGSVRFEKKEDYISTSVILSPNFKGMGFGSRIIQLGVMTFISEKKPTKPIKADIKSDNIVSIKAFQRAGFKESHLTYVYEKD